MAGAYGALLLLAAIVAARVAQAWPAALLAGLPRVGEYFSKLIPALRWSALFAGSDTDGALAWWFYKLDVWAWLLFQTSQMALLASVLAACGALTLGFFAAANLAPDRLVHWTARRVLEAFRTVPEIVYALILVWAFGIGPAAGVLAMALHGMGALGKLFAEAAENIDMRPWEGVRAAGGTWLHGVRFAVLPQVAPNLLSYALLRFEINVRGATVLGFVGAGGIGQELYSAISFNYYEDIGAILLLIVTAVTAIDLASERFRSWATGAA